MSRTLDNLKFLFLAKIKTFSQTLRATMNDGLPCGLHDEQKENAEESSDFHLGLRKAPVGVDHIGAVTPGTKFRRMTSAHDDDRWLSAQEQSPGTASKKDSVLDEPETSRRALPKRRARVEANLKITRALTPKFKTDRVEPNIAKLEPSDAEKNLFKAEEGPCRSTPAEIASGKRGSLRANSRKAAWSSALQRTRADRATNPSLRGQDAGGASKRRRPSFHLPGEIISQAKRARFQEKIQRQAQEEAVLRTKNKSRKTTRPLTKCSSRKQGEGTNRRSNTIPQPFQFSYRERNSLRQMPADRPGGEAFDIKKRPAFKAQPVPKSLYVPHKLKTVPNKKPSLPKGVLLQTEVRSGKRALYNLHFKQKQQEELERQRIAQEQDEARMKREIRSLRQRLVHKPAPILHSRLRGVKIKPSTRPVTIPQSPMVGKRSRIAQSASKLVKHE